MRTLKNLVLALLAATFGFIVISFCTVGLLQIGKFFGRHHETRDILILIACLSVIPLYTTIRTYNMTKSALECAMLFVMLIMVIINLVGFVQLVIWVVKDVTVRNIAITTCLIVMFLAVAYDAIPEKGG